MTPVLFLDAEWKPLRVESWERAMTDFFLGKVEVVEYSRDKKILGVGREFPMPSVVRVLRWFRRDRVRIKFSRLNIYARDGFRCQYCGERFPTEELTFDHVLPRSRGGRTTWENIVTCCVGCNALKADRTPHEADMRPIKTPRKPAYLPSVAVQLGAWTALPPEWRRYWFVGLEE